MKKNNSRLDKNRQSFRAYAWLIILLFISPIRYAMNNKIDIKIIEGEQTIAQILKLKEKLIQSKQPKKLSKAPYATCFKATINEFIKSTDSKQKPIYGCIFSDQIALNASLLRPGLFVHTKSGMPSDEKLFNSKLMTMVGGHDFNGKELLKYYKNAIIPKESLPGHDVYKSIENSFNQKILLPILKEHQEDFIFFAIINTKKFKENLSHELLHAQYYNMPEIRPVLLKVWSNVLPHHQNIISKSLLQGGYDIEQVELLLREFYSYFIQYNAEKYIQNIKVLSPIAPLINIYAPKIKDAFVNSNIPILTIHE